MPPKDEKKQSISQAAVDAAPAQEEAQAPQIDEELLFLQKQADSGKAELEKLREMLGVLADAQRQNVREAKILELFKKNIAAARTYEREQLLSARLKKDLGYLQQQVALFKEQEAKFGQDLPTQKEVERAAHEANMWKDKFNQATARLMEAQGAKSVLSAEISRLCHALQREVGDRIPLSKVLEEGEHWKGRAQQISLLKDRIVELEQKVQEAALDDYGGTQFDAKENACKKQLDELTTNYLVTKEELGKIKKKVDCVIARRNILETETKSVKEKIALLVAKSDNDDRLITAIRQEIEASKKALAPEKRNERIGCPIRVGSLHREHQLAASFNDLKLHCREQVILQYPSSNFCSFFLQELQIKAQAELIQYLHDITANSREA